MVTIITNTTKCAGWLMTWVMIHANNDELDEHYIFKHEIEICPKVFSQVSKVWNCVLCFIHRLSKKLSARMIFRIPRHSVSFWLISHKLVKEGAAFCSICWICPSFFLETFGKRRRGFVLHILNLSFFFFLETFGKRRRGFVLHILNLSFFFFLETFDKRRRGFVLCILNLSFFFSWNIWKKKAGALCSIFWGWKAKISLILLSFWSTRQRNIQHTYIFNHTKEFSCQTISLLGFALKTH